MLFVFLEAPSGEQVIRSVDRVNGLRSGDRYFVDFGWPIDVKILMISSTWINVPCDPLKFYFLEKKFANLQK